MPLLPESMLLDHKTTGLCVTVGAQRLLTESLAHAPAHVRAEALRHMPFLNNLRQPEKFKIGRESGLSNAGLAISFKHWLGEIQGRISLELHEQVDAWVIALTGMARSAPSLHDLNEEAAKPTPFVRHTR